MMNRIIHTILESVRSFADMYKIELLTLAAIIGIIFYVVREQLKINKVMAQ